MDVPPGTSIDDIQLPGTPATPTTPVEPPSTPRPASPRPRPRPSRAPPAPAAARRRVRAGVTSASARHASGSAEITGGDPEGGDEGSRRRRNRDRDRDGRTELRNSDGTPTASNPGFVDALPGPSTAAGVPNFIIRKFRVPPFLLPIYQAAGIEYGIRWEILAAINEIETDYGRNLNVSSAGALGWMQFMPATWQAYGTDANKDGRKDPYNPVDAIFAAARYLKAANYENDVRARDLGLQPRRLVRRLGAAARPPDRRRARRPDRLADRPHRRPLPRLRTREVRRRPRREAAAQARQAG